MEFNEVGIYGDENTPIIPPEHIPYGTWESEWIDLGQPRKLSLESNVEVMIFDGEWATIDGEKYYDRFKIKVIVPDGKTINEIKLKL